MSYSLIKSTSTLTQINEHEEPAASYRCTGLSLRNNRLKFKTSGQSPIAMHHSTGIYRIYLKFGTNDWKTTTCMNWLDLGNTRILTGSCPETMIRGEPAVSYRWTGWVWEITCFEVQDCRNITYHFRGIYRRIYPNLTKEKSGGCQHVTRMDLQTLGSQPDVPKNLPDHCPEISPDIGTATAHKVLVLSVGRAGHTRPHDYIQKSCSSHGGLSISATSRTEVLCNAKHGRYVFRRRYHPFWQESRHDEGDSDFGDSRVNRGQNLVPPPSPKNKLVYEAIWATPVHIRRNFLPPSSTSRTPR
jgi:hypothetical protein